MVEAAAKKRVRQQAAGIAIERPTDGPSFTDWAEIYFAHAEKTLRRPDRVEHLTRSALRFWGRRPASEEGQPKDASRPYHDLRLTDVVRDPSWLLRWEEWLESPKLEAGRGKTFAHLKPQRRLMSAQTKNQYRSWLSQMFQLAISPAYRLQTGVVTNPTIGTWRDPTVGREVIITVDDLKAILAVSAYHLRLAIAIGTLAPKLREGNILVLEYDKHISRDFRTIRVDSHKTARHAGAPLVVHVAEQLREILLAARARSPHQPRVITYQSQPVKDLRGAVAGAIARAAVDRPHLVYGRGVEGGITFHTLRHTAATLMAQLNISPEKRQQAMGHLRLETTMKYTHLQALEEAETIERLSSAVDIQDLVLAPRRRSLSPPTAGGKPVGTTVKTSSKTLGKIERVGDDHADGKPT